MSMATSKAIYFKHIVKYKMTEAKIATSPIDPNVRLQNTVNELIQFCTNQLLVACYILLYCLPAALSLKPDACLYRSNRLIQRGHSSGEEKLKFSGGAI